MSVIVSVIDPGCDCCSYVPVAEYDRLADVPDHYLSDRYSID
jgi:hypothetical protein